MKIRISAAAALAGLALGGLALAAPAAHATTADCRAALGNQCGTFSGQNTVGTTVYWDDSGKAAVAGNPVIGYTADSTSDAATDFTKVEHVGKIPGISLSDQSATSYSFVYTPGGRWTSLCISDPDNGSTALVLRSCNGLQWQRFVAQQASEGMAAQPVNPSVAPDFDGTYVPNGGSGTFAFLNAASHKYLSDEGNGSSMSSRQLVDVSAQDGTTSGSFGANQVWLWIA